MMTRLTQAVLSLAQLSPTLFFKLWLTTVELVTKFVNNFEQNYSQVKKSVTEKII